jgi:molybdopterin converting factor small subunit
MAVEVKLPTLLRVHTEGASSVTADGATIGDVFADLTAHYPGLAGNLVDADGQLHKFVNVYRNDDDIRYLEALDTKVADGDVISILPAVAGGAERAPLGASSHAASGPPSHGCASRRSL